MFFITRRIIKFFIIVGILAGLSYSVFTSSPVQRLFYPILYPEYVFQYANLYKIDPYLVAAVIRGESRFSHTAESGSGARGLMQIMPDTAEWAAEQLEINFHPEMLFDPEYNIRIGCWYLRRLQNDFGGNLTIVLASYNAGQGNVRNWLDNGVWDGKLAHLEQIPFSETRFYVQKVLRYYDCYRLLYEKKDLP
ncbi:MAG: lytic transglycosylase domain-containing protein [Dehalobacterium sp.]